MNRIIFSLIFFLIISPFTRAQVDSLRTIMNEGETYQQKIGAYISFTKHFTLKNFDTTLEYAARGLELARKNGDSISVGDLKSSIGVASYFKGHFDIAARNYYEALSIFEKNDAKKKMAVIHNELGKLYRKTRDLDQAIQHYDLAYNIYEELNDQSGLSMILNESGVVFEYRKDYEEAIRRYTSSLKIGESLGDKLSVSYALSNIAGVKVIQKDFAAAENNLLEALRIRKELNDSFAMALTYSDLGATMNAKSDYTKAISYLSESNRMARQLSYPELQSNNYNELYQIAVRQHDYRSALEYYMQRTNLRDSIFAIEKTRQIAELDARYETAKKEHKIDQQHNRIIRQNFLFVGIGGVVLLGGLLAQSQYKKVRLKKDAQFQTRLRQQQEQATKAVIEAEEEERRRIARDLHDSIGQMMSAAKMNLSAFEATLSLTDHEQKQSLEKIIGLVDESCREVRNVSHNMMPNALLKNNLADALQDFLNKLDKKNLEVHLFTEGLQQRLDPAIESVLYRIIQEAVNNVVRHARATTLDLSVICDHSGLSATIEDNGIGFNALDKNKFEGIGMKNIFSRVEYLKGTVDFDSAPGRGTVVTINVPITSPG